MTVKNEKYKEAESFSTLARARTHIHIDMEREREREVLTFPADKQAAQSFAVRNYYRKDLCVQKENRTFLSICCGSDV